MIKNLLYTFCALFFTTTAVTAQYCTDTAILGDATMHMFGSNGGACTLGPYSPSEFLAAADVSFYDASKVCGACAQITYGTKTLTARIVDNCSGCGPNSFDLSENAFAYFDTAWGRLPIQWKFVGCPLTGPVAFTYHGSNPYYIKVQVRNHRYPIATVEFRGTSAAYFQMTRSADNFFVANGFGGPENGPFTYRIVNVLGDTIVETGIPLLPNDSVFAGTQQFRVCAGEVTAITSISKELPVVSVYSSAANRLSIVNDNSYTIQYQVVDMLGRTAATGKLNSSSTETIRVEQVGIYIVNYSAPQFGRDAKRVMVY